MIRVSESRRASSGVCHTSFLADVLCGLDAPNKELPSKYFYDEAGSELFEQITELEEYYPTRTERGIMEQHAAEMAARCARRCLLIEYGSGSSAKTRHLLDHLRDLVGYVPIDVSGAFLKRSARALAWEYPAIEVRPLCADFTAALTLPFMRSQEARRIVYFPGSTIGNLTPNEAIDLLQETLRLCRPGGCMLIGVDLRKDTAVLERAYNDPRGVTAAFNRNLLTRVNRELRADFAVPQFAHRAFYNADEARIEMHLVSGRDQTVHIDGTRIHLGAGETIRTEYSYKYTLEGFRCLAAAVGFEPECASTDERNYFSVHLLRVAS